MPNKARPEVSIILDKERHLLLDLNAMCHFENITGKNIMQGLGASELTAKDFRALLWACLYHEDKDLTIEAVGGMIHSGNLDDITNNLAKAWDVAMPEAEEEKEDPLAIKSPDG